MTHDQLSEVITATDLQVPRDSTTLKKWIENRRAAFLTIPGGKEYLRHHKGTIKRLEEEAYPLSILMSTFHSSDERWIGYLAEDCDNYDAIVEDLRTNTKEQFEITTAIDRRMDQIRMEHLTKFGRAPAMAT